MRLDRLTNRDPAQLQTGDRCYRGTVIKARRLTAREAKRYVSGSRLLFTFFKRGHNEITSITDEQMRREQETITIYRPKLNTMTMSQQTEMFKGDVSDG